LNLKSKEGISAQRRGPGLRRSGYTPAVIFELAVPSVRVSKEMSQFITRQRVNRCLLTLRSRWWIETGCNKEYQKDPITGAMLHVDFQEILATEEKRFRFIS